jgi:hypothetical protein
MQRPKCHAQVPVNRKSRPSCKARLITFKPTLAARSFSGQECQTSTASTDPATVSAEDARLIHELAEADQREAAIAIGNAFSQMLRLSTQRELTSVNAAESLTG